MRKHSQNRFHWPRARFPFLPVHLHPAVKRTGLAASLLGIALLTGCGRQAETDRLRAEREQLERERAAIAAEKERMEREQVLARQTAEAEAEARRISEEKAKLEAEKNRLAEERGRLEEDRAARAAAENPDAGQFPSLELASNRLAEERQRVDALKVQAETDRLATERGAAEAKAREAAAKRAETEAAAEKTTAFFFEALAPHGEWFDTDRHGFVWQPKRAVLDPEWRPYADGRWQWTEYGWTWQSQEPYGWAVYHYGRWLRHPKNGWLWIPGHEWAPAWVAWRVKGSEFVGWAPLPPDRQSGRNHGPAVDRELEIAPATYLFLAIRDFDEPTYVHKFVSRERRMEMLRGSRNVTRLERRASGGNDAVVLGGPDPGMIASVIRQERNDADATPVPQLNLVLASQPAERESGDVVEGDAMLLFAPRLVKATAMGKPKGARGTLQIPQRDHNWDDASPEHETEWRSQVEREAAYAAAAQRAAAQKPASSTPRVAPTPTPQPKAVSRPVARQNPLNPSSLQPAGGLFAR